MKRLLFLALVISAFVNVHAGITTYTFTNEKWGSKVGTTICDGKTDGWVSDKNASSYSAKQPYVSAVGAKVETGASGAGATSIKSFTKVRKVTINFAQNSSKGKGVVYIQIGNNNPDSLIINKPAKSGEGVYNRDSNIVITGEPTGQIKFWINCSENAIYLNSITIRAEEGGSSPFTQSSYQLVTDVHQLRDSDQIIFGVADGSTNKIMGYYDEELSQNNIHAIKGAYNVGRTQVEANDDAVYTLWKETGETDTDTVYIFQDELRYEQAYLVASGGRTKNKLTIWDDVVSPAYGNYGFWRISMTTDGAAVIDNAGTSERKYMQYNANDQLFGCYADPNSQTKVCLYRLVKAIGTDDPAIAANMVNFGNVRLNETSVSGETRIEVNANKLTEDISCSLKQGTIFSLDATTIDRDGDYLTIRYLATEEGKYVDTLVLTSTGVTKTVTIMINVVAEKTIAEVSQSGEFDFVYLNPVVVTKKYDKYVFIRDESGSMLIYDATNPTTGKPYAQGLENGHVLSNVQGRFRNWFGVPEMTPTAAWTVAAQKVKCNPDTVLTVDSADVCTYVCFPQVELDETYMWQGAMVVDKFNTGIIAFTPTVLDAIVMIDHEQLQLWVVNQEYIPSSVNEVKGEGLKVKGKYIRNGQLYIRNNDQIYNANGQIVNQ